jgi:hypothetical protein
MGIFRRFFSASWAEASETHPLLSAICWIVVVLYSSALLAAGPWYAKIAVFVPAAYAVPRALVNLLAAVINESDSARRIDDERE